MSFHPTALFNETLFERRVGGGREISLGRGASALEPTVKRLHPQ